MKNRLEWIEFKSKTKITKRFRLFFFRSNEHCVESRRWFKFKFVVFNSLRNDKKNSNRWTENRKCFFIWFYFFNSINCFCKISKGNECNRSESTRKSADERHWSNSFQSLEHCESKRKIFRSSIRFERKEKKKKPLVKLRFRDRICFEIIWICFKYFPNWSKTNCLGFGKEFSRRRCSCWFFVVFDKDLPRVGLDVSGDAKRERWKCFFEFDVS